MIGGKSEHWRLFKRIKQNYLSQTRGEYYNDNSNIIKIDRWKNTVFVNRS